MNSFTFVGIGNLARNPEITTKGNTPLVRFCLVGTDQAEPDEETSHAREVVNSIWFTAFDELADRIAVHARKGDQLIVTARVRSRGRTDGHGDSRSEYDFIVTGVRLGAMRGPGSAASSLRVPRPEDPKEPAAHTVKTMTG